MASEPHDRGTMSFEYSNGEFRSNYVEINPTNSNVDNFAEGENTNSTQINGEVQDDAKLKKEKKLKKDRKIKKEKKDKKSKSRRERSSSSIHLEHDDNNNNNSENNHNGTSPHSNSTPVKPNEKETQTLEDNSGADSYAAYNIPGSRASWKYSGFTLEDDPHKLADSNGIVNLNVGGTYYATTIETLKSDPGSMLSAMFSGVYRLRKDKNDAYFIDRDGHYFRFILNYLRDGTLDLMQEEYQLKQLLREAQYFQVSGLIKMIEESIQNIYDQREKENKGQYAVVYLGGYGKQAQIYTKDTGGGFSDSCVTLNKLAAEGYHIEGVASGANGHYYAILRTKETDKSIFKKTTY